MPEYFSVEQDQSGVCGQLSEFASRIGTLLEANIRSRGLSACLDDLLGAVYSLFYATRHEYTDRTQELNAAAMKHVTHRARSMAQGRIRTDGKWTAGFYFNNTLFRLAAVYHRSLKVVTGKEETEMKVGPLLLIAQEAFRALRQEDWKNCKLHEIHRQVNGLKHTGSGIYGGRKVLFKDAVEAIEELLVLIETLGHQAVQNVSDELAFAETVGKSGAGE
ncbi:MAG: hypothetical protein ABSD88_00455 [Candidatus Korobacteraceae bacterium]